MAELLKGAPVAEALAERCTADVEACKAKGVEPTLAILRVGERDDDLSYERGATKRCEAVGVAVKNVVLPADVDQATMMATIEDLNNDAGVHGVLMFRPLPKQLDEAACCEALAAAKDVDAATTASLAHVFTGKGEGYAPCTAQACMEILSHYGIDPKGKRAAVIGRSLVIGKPVSMMLMAANATVTTCHTKTVDMPSVTKEADIVVVAAGQMETIGADYFKAGQTVVDVGIGWNEEKGKLCGDVIFDEAEPIVEAITPVPGGVGSVTTAVLVSHVVEA
ncbi:MAG: bifunctional 5,10-methylenetetrahydrofolate dehydrogenase/5,10-methenyltetrahydrofolate cyclohydrolase, partial [Eggerthellaceae bacterium]|nr:bifunctional 5,10-methylenetetrahydrofolate dehydrogenase/5,10-methenyltetrahydrofolate cyclohydrolase [Eggerthellaceae bacterium]